MDIPGAGRISRGIVVIALLTIEIKERNGKAKPAGTANSLPLKGKQCYSFCITCSKNGGKMTTNHHEVFWVCGKYKPECIEYHFNVYGKGMPWVRAPVASDFSTTCRSKNVGNAG